MFLLLSTLVLFLSLPGLIFVYEQKEVLSGIKFAPKFQNSLLKHEKHLRRWCINLTATKGGLGTKLDADRRNIYVRTIQKNNRNVKILTFEFSSKGGKAKKIIRKIINEKQ